MPLLSDLCNQLLVLVFGLNFRHPGLSEGDLAAFFSRPIARKTNSELSREVPRLFLRCGRWPIHLQ